VSGTAVTTCPLWTERCSSLLLSPSRTKSDNTSPASHLSARTDIVLIVMMSSHCALTIPAPSHSSNHPAHINFPSPVPSHPPQLDPRVRCFPLALSRTPALRRPEPVWRPVARRREQNNQVHGRVACCRVEEVRGVQAEVGQRGERDGGGEVHGAGSSAYQRGRRGSRLAPGDLFDGRCEELLL
jgi:hypothetical protein